jgi:hypothetical protein
MVRLRYTRPTTLSHTIESVRLHASAVIPVT